MTNLWMGLLLVSALAWPVLAWWMWRTERRVWDLEERLRGHPLTPSAFREPEPGSYILSDAEAAQVEAALLAESRGRATSRGARGWRGFKSS